MTEQLGHEHIDPSPKMGFEFEGKEIELNWYNTLVRKFDIGEGAFDHVLVTFPEGFYPDGSRIGSFKGEEGLIDELITLRYPHRTDPVLDELAKNSIAAYEAVELEDELRRTSEDGPDTFGWDSGKSN